MSIRESPETQNAYEKRLRSADILLIDDIQYLVGRGSSAEMLFANIDYLLAKGKLIVVTGDVEPNELNWDERYKRRLSQGTVVKMTAAVYAMKMLQKGMEGQAYSAGLDTEESIDELVAEVRGEIPK